MDLAVVAGSQAMANDWILPITSAILGLGTIVGTTWTPPSPQPTTTGGPAGNGVRRWTR